MATGIFGCDLETVVNRESIASEIMKGDAVNIPTIVRRCVEEVERRGLDIIGLLILHFCIFNIILLLNIL